MATAVKKYPGLKRRIGGWALVTLAVLVAGVWAASRYCVLWSSRQSSLLLIDGGMVSYTVGSPGFHANPPGLGVGNGNPYHEGFHWRTPYSLPHPYVVNGWDAFLVGRYTFQAGFTGLYIVLWPLPLLLTLAGVPVLRSGVRARRRAVAGSCPACGYDRRGIPAAAVCPECGKG